MTKKAQISIEFLSYTSIFMIAFFIMLFLFVSLGTAEVKHNTYLTAYEIGNRFAMAVSSVASLGKGACFLLSLPSTINGFSYNITISPGENAYSGVVNVNDGIFGLTSNTAYGFYLIKGPINIYDKNGHSLTAINGGLNIAIVKDNTGIAIISGGNCNG